MEWQYAFYDVLLLLRATPNR